MALSALTSAGNAPPPLAQSAAATAGNHSVYVFGGRSSSDFSAGLWRTVGEGEWWQSKKVEWEQLSSHGGNDSANTASASAGGVDVVGPSARRGATLVWVGGAVNRLILVGGETRDNKKTRDVFAFDPAANAWDHGAQAESTSGVDPGSRVSHVCVPVLAENSGEAGAVIARLLIHGGDDIEDENRALAVLSILRGPEGSPFEYKWSLPSQGGDGAPEPRKNHCASIHKHRMYLHGGFGNRSRENLEDVWALDVSDASSTDAQFSWTRAPIKGPVPESRTGHACAVMGDFFVVWGGWGAGSNRYDEIHYMNLDDFTWNKRKPMMKVPAERFFHAAALCGPKQLLMIGGQLGDSATKDYTSECILLDSSRIY